MWGFAMSSVLSPLHADDPHGAISTDVVPALTAPRRDDHLRINLQEDEHTTRVVNGFDRYRFVHQALPDLDFAGVETGLTLFGRRLAAPLAIACMTAGTPATDRVTATLAEGADALGLPLGLGSARVLLEEPAQAAAVRVRAYAPDVLLFAHLGAVQLNKGVSVDACRRLLELLDADALVLHLNPLQEALQPDGDPSFAGLLPRIAALCRQLERPVIVKEAGWGLAPDVVRALFDAGVCAVDVAGAGGTSWSAGERHRLEPPWKQRVADAFGGWGIPTAEAVRAARATAPNDLVFASGGIRDGLDVAKALALGADLVGLAGPFLRAAADGGVAGVVDLGRELITTLRLVMFCVGARDLAAFRQQSRVVAEDATRSRRYGDVLRYYTAEAGAFRDITADVQALVARSGVRDGQVHVFSQHTTAAIRINEAEPLLMTDFRALLARLVPAGGFRHDNMTERGDVPTDEPINGHAHCQHLLLASSETIPISAGRLALGPWQRLFLIELCSPRTRAVSVNVTGWS